MSPPFLASLIVPQTSLNKAVRHRRKRSKVTTLPGVASPSAPSWRWWGGGNAAPLTSQGSGFETPETGREVAAPPSAEAPPVGVYKRLQLPPVGGCWDLQVRRAENTL